MITPFRNEYLDKECPVEVYRNTSRKGVVYSIRQDGIVRAHADELFLVNAEFIVREAGRKRVKRTGTKNVHAWVRGELATFVKPDKYDKRALHQVKYDPRKLKTFVKVKTGKAIKEAPAVSLTSKGVFAFGAVNL